MSVHSATCGTGRWLGTATGWQRIASVMSCRSARISACVPIDARRLEIRSAWLGAKTTNAASTTAPIAAQYGRHGCARGSASQPKTPAPQNTASSAAGSSR